MGNRRVGKNVKKINQSYRQNKFKWIFHHAPIAIIEQDFSALAKILKTFGRPRIKNFRNYWQKRSDEVKKTAQEIKVIDFNHAAFRLYRAKDKSAVVANIGKMLVRNVQVLLDEWMALAHGRKNFEAEIKCKTGRGEMRDILLRVTVPEEYEHSLERVIVTLQDITAQKRLERHLKKMAQLDGLTKLLNQHEIARRLDEEMVRAKRYGLDLSCLMIDVDHFKVINDKFGHPRGDQILKRVASFLKEGIRRSDIIGRYGGDEFLMIFPQTSPQNAKIAALRIKKIFADKMMKYQKNLPIQNTLSIGISGYPTKDVKSPKDLIVQADKALYLAKASGRDTIVIV